MKTKGAEKHFWTPIPLGETSSPIPFTTPEGDKGRIWVSDRTNRKGEEVYWRVNIAEARKRAAEAAREREANRSKFDRPADLVGGPQRGRVDPELRQAILDAELVPPLKGFKVRLMLQDEAPAIGCGNRLVVVQFRGKKVILHCAGYTQAIKRDVFKELVSSNERYRARNRNVPGIPTPNVDLEVRWEEPLPTPAPNEESFKPNYTGTLKGDDYPIAMDADGYPIMPACLRRTVVSTVVGTAEEIELIPTILPDADEAA